MKRTEHKGSFVSPCGFFFLLKIPRKGLRLRLALHGFGAEFLKMAGRLLMAPSPSLPE